jgi:RNA polymerase sigma-70 factor (ECF subfamily)
MNDAAGSVVTTLMTEALRSLSAEHRDAIVQAYYFNMSLREISRREHISESAVRTRLHDALRALQLATVDGGVLG